MPKGEIKVVSESCWAQKSTLEKVLIGCLALAILVVLILIILLACSKSTSDVASVVVCSSPSCIAESAKISEHLDTQASPCGNLYKHACGKFLANSHGDDKLALFHKLSEQVKREMLELYKETNKDDDHKTVKAARNLFKACMNETEIARDNLKTIKETIKLVGGWPVIEGAKWNESNYDWIRSSAVLRKLGYYYSIFVDMQIDADPNNASISMLKVTPPNLWDFSSRNFDKIDFMIDVAEAFGARNRKEAAMEMTQTNAFLLQMQFESHSKHTQISYRKYKVEEYQKMFGDGMVDWLLFINNVVGRTAKITKDDYVLFPPPELFKAWFEFISKTTKRTLANYVIWKVIEESLPYLTEDLRERKTRITKAESRDVFCFSETQHRFVPDPIAVLYARRYLTKEKKTKIEDIFNGIKSELKTTVSKMKWMDEDDKKNLVERINSINVVIGQPGTYGTDTIFNDMDVDMMEIKSNAFLSLLAQATRNRQTQLFNQIKVTGEQNLSEKWYIKGGGTLPFYSVDDNVFYIPTAVTKYYLFDENRPQYLNYGALGTQLSYQLTNILNPNLRNREKIKPWSNETKEAMQKISTCLDDEARNSPNPNADVFKIDYVLQQNFARLAYEAYQKQNQQPDVKLVGIDYTPKQLFWLTSVMVMCEPGSKTAYAENPYVEFVQTSPQFLKDFECPAKADYLEKCHFV